MTQRATIELMQEPRTTTISSEETSLPKAVESPPIPSEPEEKGSIVELFETHESALIRFAYGLIKRREVAEEIVQDAFLKLHQHWHEVENPRAWIYRSIRNLCLNHLRKYKRELDEADEKVVDITEAASENKLERMEAIGNVRLIIAELEPDERELIRLKYMEGKSYSDIATATGLTSGNVGYKLHHVLKTMGDALKKLGVESSIG